MATVITVLSNGQVKIKKGSSTPIYYANGDYTARIDASQGVVYLWDITQNARSIDFAPEDTTVGGTNYPTLEGLCEALNVSPYFFKAGSGGGGGTSVCPSTAAYQTLSADGAGGWCISDNAFSTPSPVPTDLLLTGSYELSALLAGEVWSDGANKTITNLINVNDEYAELAYYDDGLGLEIVCQVNDTRWEAKWGDSANAFFCETTATTGQFRSTESTGFFTYFAGINANGSEVRYEDSLTPKTHYIRVNNSLAQMYATGASTNEGQVTATETGATLQFFEGAASSLASVSSKLARLFFENGTVSNFARVNDKQAAIEFSNGSETAGVAANAAGVAISSTTGSITLNTVDGVIYAAGSQQDQQRTETADYLVARGDYAIYAHTGVSTVTLPSTALNGETYEVKNMTGGDITVDGNGHNIDGAATITLPNTNAVKLRYNETVGIEQWGVW